MARKKIIRTRKLFSWKKYLLLIAGVFAITTASLFFTDKLNKPECANSESCIKNLSGKPEDAKTGYFMGKEVNVPQTVAQTQDEKVVLGDSTDKHIYID